MLFILCGGVPSFVAVPGGLPVVVVEVDETKLNLCFFRGAAELFLLKASEVEEVSRKSPSAGISNRASNMSGPNGLPVLLPRLPLTSDLISLEGELQS